MNSLAAVQIDDDEDYDPEVVSQISEESKLEEDDTIEPEGEPAPRLDIVLTLNDGVTVRYHPKAALIYSTETQPTKAMQERYNLATTLRRKQTRGA